MSRAVAWVCPAEQDRRFAIMLGKLEAQTLSAVAVRCASGEAQADLEVMLSVERRQAAERAAAQMARLDAQRSRREAAGTSDADRAAAYLATIDGGPRNAHRAAIVLVRGFALPEETALQLLETEYAPRYHRKLPKRELVGLVRWASRASVELGYMLRRNGRE